MTNVIVPLGGWGRAGWGDGPWSQSGLPLATAGVGTVTVDAQANVPAVGLVATGAVGGVTVIAEANVSVAGVSALAETVRSGGFTAYAQAKLSTARSKFGPSSLATDGSLDLVFSNETCVFGSGDFTVEMWVYRASNPATSYFIFDNRIDSNNGTVVVIDSLGRFRLIVNGGAGGSIYSSSTSTGVWNHVAIVRNGTNLSLYVNGTSAGSVTNSTDYSNRKYGIGAGYFTLGYLSLLGNIDEFRASTVARYTTNFTPATAEFSPDVDTEALLHFDGANNSTQITNSATADLITVVGEANIYPTGVEATGEIGTPTINAGANVNVTGLAATPAVGSVAVETDANVDVTGVVATGQIGTATVTGDANVPVTGITATGGVGSVTVVAEANVYPNGVTASGAVNGVTVTGEANIPATGIAATGAVGSVSIITVVDVLVTGVSGTGTVGQVTIDAEAKVYPTGVSATTNEPYVLVWGQIKPNPDTVWAEVTGSEKTWDENAPNPGTVWTKIAA